MIKKDTFLFVDKNLNRFMFISVAVSGLFSLGILLHRNYKAVLLIVLQGFILYAFWRRKNWVLSLLFMNSLGYIISGFLILYSIFVLSKLSLPYAIAGGLLFILGIIHLLVLNRVTGNKV